MRLTIYLCFILIASLIAAQPSVQYRLDLNNIRHHELRIAVTFKNLRQDSLVIRMPNTSPGRYAGHNFVKNLYEERSYNRRGEETWILRTTPFSWKIPVTNGYAGFSYTLYGNHADGTYTGIDSKKLHLNMPATFVYGEGLNDLPVDLVINLADKPEWSVATQLVKTNDSTFSAPDYYYFYDSPTIAGDIDWRSWTVDDQRIEVAMMHQGTDDELDAYVEWIKKIVLEEKAVFGKLPPFDYGRYTFLLTYNPWVHGDGMEHRNSTICSSSGNLADHAERLIGTVAHEFFHAWNIERIRPRSLEPFDFKQISLSGELWFGEGFTSYYDDLVLVRAGITTPDQYVSGLTGTMNYVINSPGRTIRNPIEMSHNAPFVDAAKANDETNYHNNFISYYSYGAVLGLGLDLMIRSTFEGLTLDDYMKYVWEKFGEPELPYTVSDLQTSLATVIKDEAFAKSFFEQYIYNSKLPDFNHLFSQFGIRMEPANPGATDLNRTTLNDKGVITSPILMNTSLYNAGLERGDQILFVDERQITSGTDLTKIARILEDGKTYTITYKQLGEEVTTTFTARADPAFRLVYLSDQEITDQVQERRASWLKGN